MLKYILSIENNDFIPIIMIPIQTIDSLDIFVKNDVMSSRYINL